MTTKASLFNFVIYTHDENKVPYYEELIRGVIKKFPCRILFIKGKRASCEENFRVEKSEIVEEGITCDYIEIYASGTHLNQVPFYILPHLATDLPLILLWGEDPTTDSEILPKLISYADRLIYEPDRECDLKSFSKNLLSKLDKISCDIVDMNWARLAGWRDVIYNAVSIRDLPLIKSVSVTYNGKKYSTQARYFIGWLASRLKWNCVDITLKSENFDQMLNGALLEVTITTTEGKIIHFQRDQSAPKQVKVSVSNEEVCEIPYNVPLTTGSNGPSFIKEILYAVPCGQYKEMLQELSGEKL